MLVCCAGIPPQLSGPSACRTSLLTPHPVVVCFAWCVATSFPPVSAILTIVTCCCRPLYTPAKAATKHNTTQPIPTKQYADTFQSSSSIRRLPSPLSSPPATEAPCRSLPPAPNPPPPMRRASPVSRDFHAPSRISPYLGLPLPCPILAWPALSALSCSFVLCLGLIDLTASGSFLSCPFRSLLTHLQTPNPNPNPNPNPHLHP